MIHNCDNLFLTIKSRYILFLILLFYIHVECYFISFYSMLWQCDIVYPPSNIYSFCERILFYYILKIFYSLTIWYCVSNVKPFYLFIFLWNEFVFIYFILFYEVLFDYMVLCTKCQMFCYIHFCEMNFWFLLFYYFIFAAFCMHVEL